MERLRIALVGCGIISGAHIRSYQRHADRAVVTVCCDIDAEKAGRRAEEAGGARATTDFNEVLADPEVDAVEIRTPHPYHPESVIAAARAGKQILCQKPLARTLRECDEMIAAAREAGVVLFYGETNRTMAPAVEAKRVVDSGRIGRVIGIQGTFAHWQGGEYMSTAWRYDPKVTGGGALLDAGIHAISVMNQVGGAIESVFCQTTRFRPELGGEDTSALVAVHQSGALGQLFSSQASAVWSPGALMTIYGLEGALTLGGPHGALTLHRPDLPDRQETLLPRESWGDTFAVMHGRYLDAVQKGVENPSPGEVGREDLRVVLAAYESARLGRLVRLADIEPAADATH